MPRTEKTKAELETDLYEQIEALRSSAAAYDRGVKWEAKRLSTAVYTIAHDWPSAKRNTLHKSLLKTLNLKSEMKFLSTVRQLSEIQKRLFAEASFITAHSSLISISHINGRVEYVPNFQNSDQRWLDFNDWYTESIFDDFSPYEMTRNNVVSIMRSQDGGSHVDDRITNDSYIKFTREGDPGLEITRIDLDTGEKISEPNPLQHGNHAIIRQIAWELDASLRNAGFK